MHRPTRSDGADSILHSPRSRAASISSDRPSLSGSYAGSITSPLPPNVLPAPGYVSVAGATRLVTEHHAAQIRDDYGPNVTPPSEDDTAIFSHEGISLINSFCDSLLFSIVCSAKAPSSNAIRPALFDVLKPKLAHEAAARGDQEIDELGGVDDEDDTIDPDFNPELVWRRTRLRVMVYMGLGEFEDDDEQQYLEEDESFGMSVQDEDHSYDKWLVTWPSAILLTSVIEYMAEQAVLMAGEAAYGRTHGKHKRTASSATAQSASFYEPDRVVVQEADVEKIALNPTFGKLWRSWRRRLRYPNTPISPSRSMPWRELPPPSEHHDDTRGSDSDNVQPRRLLPNEVPETEATETDIAANIPLPMTENDIAEIENPALAFDVVSSGAQTPVIGTSSRPMSAFYLPYRNDEDDTEHFVDAYSGRWRPISMPPAERGEFIVVERQQPQPVDDSEIDESPSEEAEEATRREELALAAARAAATSVAGAPATENEASHGEESSLAKAPAAAPIGIVTDNAQSETPVSIGSNGAGPNDRAEANVTQSQMLPAPTRPEVARITPPALRPPITKESSSFYDVSPISPTNSQSPDDDAIGVAKTSNTARFNNPPPAERAQSATKVTILNQPDEAGQVPTAAKALTGQQSQTSSRSIPPAAAIAATAAAAATVGVVAAATASRSHTPSQPASTGSLRKHSASDFLVSQTGRTSGPQETRTKVSQVGAQPVQPRQTSHHRVTSTEVKAEAEDSVSPIRRREVGRPANGARHTPPPLAASTSAGSPNLSSQVNRRQPSPKWSTHQRTSDVGSEHDGDRSTFQRVSTGSSSKSANTSTLHSAKGSDASLSRPRGPSFTRRMSEEDRIREFDSLVRGEETVKYTLTPTAVREAEGYESPSHKARVQATKTPLSKAPGSPRALSGSGSGSSTSTPHSDPFVSRSSSSIQEDSGRVVRPSQQNTARNRLPGLPLPREARVQTEPLRDLADFFRSTAPTAEPAQPQPMQQSNAANMPRISTSSSNLGRKLSTRSGSTINRLKPREAAVNDSSTSALIDFIREGPPREQPRIPRTVAPFRSTVDSDEWNGMMVESSSKHSTATSANSRTGLIQPGTTQPAYSSQPPSLSEGARAHTGPSSSGPAGIPSAFPDSGSSGPGAMPPRRRHRNKDPYAIDLSDEDEDEDDEISALPVRRAGRQGDGESLMDFLNSVEPPAQNDPVPFALAMNGATIQTPSTGGSLPGTNGSTTPIARPYDNRPRPTGNGSIPRMQAASAGAGPRMAGGNRLVARSDNAGAVRAARLEERRNINDLADFFRTSAPPPENMPQTSQHEGGKEPKEKKSKTSFWRRKTSNVEA